MPREKRERDPEQIMRETETETHRNRERGEKKKMRNDQGNQCFI